MFTMENIFLTIIYQGKFICECNKTKYDFIEVPHYYSDNDNYGNITIFLNLFFHGLLNDSYTSQKAHTVDEWETMFLEQEIVPEPDQEVIIETAPNTYVFDMDKMLKELYPEYIDEVKTIIENSISHIPSRLKYISLPELEQLASLKEKTDLDYDTPTSYNVNPNWVEPSFMKTIKSYTHPRTEKDVLLLYSGGKDSTLAAIRLRKMGYNVYFIHFNNGHMRDSDKPFLTFQETFAKKEGYFFNYTNSDINIATTFEELFKPWKQEDDSLLDGSMTSEIRCLSCRSAMYMKAIEVALENGFKYIAEGARINQKFMLEQVPMIKEYRSLCQSRGLTLLCPVLTLDDDKVLIDELLAAGFSAKSWESKCLLGRRAREKSEVEQSEIVKYYKEHIEPIAKQKVLK